MGMNKGKYDVLPPNKKSEVRADGLGLLRELRLQLFDWEIECTRGDIL